MLLQSRLVLAVLLSSFLGIAASAKPYLNSLCYLEDRPEAKVQGSNSQRRYEIASLSKIVTSYWSLANLGANYRFKTTIHATSLGNRLYDVHISGGRDPFFGRELTYFLISELTRLEISNIRRLTFDENFTYYWDVRERPIPSVKPNPSYIETTLRQRLKFSLKQYQFVRQAAQNLGVSMVSAPSLRVGSVQFLSKLHFTPGLETKSFELRSVPLHKYLKEMNRNSNNHVADRIFDSLGGPTAFQDFVKTQLGYNSSEIRFVNGSGDSVVISNDGGQRSKIYNEATCEAVVRILDATRGVLATSNLDLEDIMSVSGDDTKSTLKGRYSASSLSGAMVAKTGTVDPAVGLAGMISTEDGDVYFGILYHTSGAGDWNRGRDAIRNEIVQLMAKYHGKQDIRGYSVRTFLPFDGQSRATRTGSESLALQSLN